MGIGDQTHIGHRHMPSSLENNPNHLVKTQLKPYNFFYWQLKPHNGKWFIPKVYFFMNRIVSRIKEVKLRCIQGRAHYFEQI